jgi:Fe-S cluster assembly iron-binding protein IscA
MNNLIDWVLEKETPEIQIKSPKVKALMYCKESVEKIGFTWEEE